MGLGKGLGGMDSQVIFFESSSQEGLSERLNGVSLIKHSESIPLSKKFPKLEFYSTFHIQTMLDSLYDDVYNVEHCLLWLALEYSQNYLKTL